MRRRITTAACCLWLIQSAFAVDVATEAEWRSAVAARETPIVFVASDITLTDDLVIDYSCALYSDDTQTAVCIDCNDNSVILRDAVYNVGRADFPQRIRFMHGGSAGCVSVQSVNAATEASFWHTDFWFADSGNGLSTRSGDYVLTVTCNDCEASYNYADGFNAHNFIGTNAPHSLTLCDCIATGNDLEATGSPNGDGATCHDSNQVLTIEGGAYTNNGKYGIVAVGGCSVSITGGVAINNATVTTTATDLYVNGGGSVDYAGLTAKRVRAVAGEWRLTAGRVLTWLRIDGGAAVTAEGFGFQWAGTRLTGFWGDWGRLDVPCYDSASAGRLEAVTVTMPPRPGDSDGDNDLDLADWAAFQPCMTAPGNSIEPACSWAQFDDDIDLDLADAAAFQRAYVWRLPDR